MEFMTTERAVDFIAAHLLDHLVEMYGGDCWDNYPEIGEHDWERVVDRAKEIADNPGTLAFNASYNYLKSRADQ